MLIKNLIANLIQESRMKKILFVDINGKQDIRFTKLVPELGNYIQLHGIVPGNVISVIWYPWMEFHWIDESIDVYVQI